MNYKQAIEFLHDRLRLGSRPGLDNIRELLKRLGDPQNRLKYIHVAGTNGKGSTCSYISNVLMKKGFKTGMYISPFVRDFRERISVDGGYIPEDALAKCTAMIRDVIGDGLEVTEFEIITAVAFLYFVMCNCDYVVLEVGLGGRFDATNIINPPHVCVITSISIDHTELLGDTVEKIAFEKCGIIKPGAAVAAYCDNPAGANSVIREAAAKNRCELFIADKGSLEITKQSINGSEFVYQDRPYKISMPGKHQVYNAVTAITACRCLGIDYETVFEGLKAAKFGGRFEKVQSNPDVIVDGAHNYGAVLTLKETLKACYGGRDIILVMGMLRDKEYEKCIGEIAGVAKLFIATQPDNPRYLPAEEMAEIAKRYNNNVITRPEGKDAFKLAVSRAGSDGVVCVCGSLYLIGDLKEM